MRCTKATGKLRVLFERIGFVRHQVVQSTEVDSVVMLLVVGILRKGLEVQGESAEVRKLRLQWSTRVKQEPIEEPTTQRGNLARIVISATQEQLTNRLREASSVAPIRNIFRGIPYSGQRQSERDLFEECLSKVVNSYENDGSVVSLAEQFIVMRAPHLSDKIN